MFITVSFQEPELPPNAETFVDHVQNLIRKFDSDRNHYLPKAYSEAQARVDFMTPFFKALGWDVENEAGLPHHDREVIVERGESDTTGRPDYNFRMNAQTKFFVEVKGYARGLTGGEGKANIVRGRRRGPLYPVKGIHLA